MDAKIGDWVVTPRIGKPVEVNALWYNALLAMADFSVALGVAPDSYQEAAGKALRNFGKFWNDGAGYCYDVIDAPGIGCDAAVRPNPIFAVSLAHSPLSSEQQRAIVDVCARRLLTSFGLRSLAPGEPGYAGHYAGGPHERDAAYHQGTAWGWLLGPFALAHLRVHRDARAAASFLEPLGNQVRANGLGTLGEVFDGDAPFTPRGCIAQAWTVAELLRAWRTTLAGLKDGSKLVARDGDAGSGRAAPAS
jgi:glycogen debranching enzyme